MEERSQSQSRMRPRPLFAERQAVDRSSWPSVSVHLDSPLAKAADPSHSYLGQYERVSENDGQDDIAGTYRAHVDRSILSMQRQDKRHSWYLLDSLIQMQGALDQTITETPRPNSRLLSDDRISSAQIRALLHQLETGNNGTSDDEMKATPADLPAILRSALQTLARPWPSAIRSRSSDLTIPLPLQRLRHLSSPLAIPKGHPRSPWGRGGLSHQLRMWRTKMS
jgi:hypothetical protein